jgi:hypothetical protein
MEANAGTVTLVIAALLLAGVVGYVLWSKAKGKKGR